MPAWICPTKLAMQFPCRFHTGAVCARPVGALRAISGDFSESGGLNRLILKPESRKDDSRSQNLIPRIR
eukprot:3000857-Pyramimonas_sp.AAC.1